MTLPLDFVFAGLLIAHFVGDFLFQTDEMALKKSTNWSALGAHVGVYTFAVTAAFAVLVQHSVLEFAAMTYALHFATDAITSRFTTRFWFVEENKDQARIEWVEMNVQGEKLAWKADEDKGWRQMRLRPGYRHKFFVMIGFDQLLHALALWGTLRLLY